MRYVKIYTETKKQIGFVTKMKYNPLKGKLGRASDSASEGAFMVGYKLQLPKDIPNIIWACKAKVENYNWQNNNKSNMIEFSASKAARRTIVDARCGAEKTVEGEIFGCLVGDGKWKSYAGDDVTVEVLSVAISFDELSYIEKEFDIDDAADEGCILLPHFIEGRDERMADCFENILYRIVESHKENCASSALICGANALNLMFELDRTVRKSIKAKNNKYVHYYVDKAESILHKRYFEKITLKNVALELGVTPNYLSAIFKSSKGVGFTDRLLEIRMKKAELLLKEAKLSEAEISSLVGYDEIGHFRRRFKQYFGVGIRDYRCINNELTLYHDKPQKK